MQNYKIGMSQQQPSQHSASPLSDRPPRDLLSGDGVWIETALLRRLAIAYQSVLVAIEQRQPGQGSKVMALSLQEADKFMAVVPEAELNDYVIEILSKVRELGKEEES